MSEGEQIEIDLAEKFPDLQPTSSVPSLWDVLGFGMGLYGTRDFDEETYSFVKTHCITALWIPVFALRAYRMAVTEQGVLVLGRQPISTFARLSNYLVVSCVLFAVGIRVWSSYTNSPDYIASRRLAEADRFLESGELAKAARLYREVAVGSTGHTAAARDKFNVLLQGPVREAAPTQAAEVLQIALEMHEQAEGSVDPAGVLEVGTELVDRFEKPDPRGALAVLEVIAPLALDTDELIVKRQGLLEAIVRREPDDPEAASQLALIYEAQGEMDKSEKLLTPYGDRLGIHEGARILGRIFSERGEHDKAVAMLLPYAEGRLKRLHDAEKALEDAITNVQQRILEEIENGEAPQSFYERGRKLDEDGQSAMVWEYVQAKTRDDPLIKQRHQALLQEAPVVPVALDLGISLLQRAQRLAEPDARRAQLEKAEQVFLAVRGMAGETNEYRLSLGQVYYWLGKHKEGRELFDQLLESNDRKFELLMAVSNSLRDVGASSESRTLSEEAYHKTADKEKQHQAASLRAITHLDLDDRIAWLRRANQSNPHVKAQLSSSMASQAMRDGNDDLAVEYFRKTIDIYAAQPENEATLNNAALAYFSLFQLTGDPTALENGTAKVEKALAINPSNSILLGNAASAVLEGGLRDIIGDAIDLKLLKSGGSISLLSYLYEEQSGRQAYAERIKKDPRVEKAVNYLERVLVLAPKRVDAYATIASIHEYTRDVKALRDLLRRIEQSDPDLSDQIRTMQEYYAGKDDETKRQAVDSGIARSEEILSAANAKGGATFAIAATSLVTQMISGSALGREVDASRIVELAEQAYAAAPSVPTHSTLAAALCFRAGRTLAEQEPAYAEMLSKAERSLGHSYLLAVSLSGEGRLREAVLANPDVQRVTALLVESMEKFPDHYGPWDWAMLRAAQPEAAGKLAEIIKANQVVQVTQQISLRLSPASGPAAFHSSWASQIAGNDAAALEVLRHCADRGVPLPFDFD